MAATMAVTRRARFTDLGDPLSWTLVDDYGARTLQVRTLEKAVILQRPLDDELWHDALIVEPATIPDDFKHPDFACPGEPDPLRIYVRKDAESPWEIKSWTMWAETLPTTRAPAKFALKVLVRGVITHTAHISSGYRSGPNLRAKIVKLLRT